MIKEGSIIVYSDQNVYTVSIVNRVEGSELYCSESICSMDGGETFHKTSSLIANYEGEIMGEGVRLIDTGEFDVVYDTKLIDKKHFKNLTY